MSDIVLDRHARARAAAGAVDIDVLLLGRRDNVRYVAGVEQLWMAGTRPFGAVATFAVASGEINVMSTWEEGMSDLVDFDHLHGLTWNPATMAERLRANGAVVGATRIGVDALSPAFAELLRAVAPNAQIVPADQCLHGARRVKLPAEVERIRAAVAIGDRACEAAKAALGSGVRESAVAAAAMATAQREGRLQPAGPVTVRRTDDRRYSRPEGSTDAVVDAGSLVRIDVSFLADGYEGGLGRTVSVDLAGPTINRLRDELDERHGALTDACRAGATGAELAAAAPEHWMVRGLGLGFEPPIIDGRTGLNIGLEAGMVLSVESAVFLDGMGTMSRRDTVLITENTPEVLTESGSGSVS